jgi:hypothetical protein
MTEPLTQGVREDIRSTQNRSWTAAGYSPVQFRALLPSRWGKAVCACVKPGGSRTVYFSVHFIKTKPVP